MSDNNTPIELSDQQIELVKVFNKVADKFVALLIQDCLSEEIVKDIGADQANSFLSERAMLEMYSESLPLESENTRYQIYLNAVKGAALGHSRELYEMASEYKMRRASKTLKEAIVRTMIVTACQLNEIPKEVFINPDSKLGVPPLIPN